MEILANSPNQVSFARNETQWFEKEKLFEGRKLLIETGLRKEIQPVNLKGDFQYQDESYWHAIIAQFGQTGFQSKTPNSSLQN